MEKEKLIIENKTDKSMYFVLAHIRHIIEGGKVSNNGKEYAYVSTFNDGICVCSSKNKKSDKLTITYRKDLDDFNK